MSVLLDEGIAFGGGVGDKVADKAEELDAAAVVVASHPKNRFTEFLMGSVSNFLVHHCPQPVLVLRAPPEVRLPLDCMHQTGCQPLDTVTCCIRFRPLVPRLLALLALTGWA